MAHGCQNSMQSSSHRPARPVTRCISLHREEYGKLFDFVNVKKLNIKNRGLKEVPLSVEEMSLSPVLSVLGKGRDFSGFFFTLFSLLILIEKRGACDPSPPPGAGFLSMTLDQSLQPLRSPQWGWEREGLGLT